MEDRYQFSFGYLALKMLGKTLYSNPFAALSELIANGFDANANKVWVRLDIRNKKNAEVIVIDNGNGMSDYVLRDKYLQVGKKNRNLTDKKMMGRKGIGKLAAFYLSNDYFVVTKTENENNIYEINFTEYENGNISEDNNTYKYINKINEFSFNDCEIYNTLKTGTAIVMKNVNFSGYGVKTFEVLESELSELFSFESITREIFLKIIDNDSNLANSYRKVEKKIAFKNMSKILYNIPDNEFENIIKLDGMIIKNTENLSDETQVKISVERYDESADEAIVGENKITIKPRGWVGIHHTINRTLAHKNDNNFLENSRYQFNKIRIYIRGKLALENILPLVHNTQYYAHYIEGEIHCDELDLNDLPDITSSNRQDLDKNDGRVIALVKYVKEIVNYLVNFKDKQVKDDKQKHETKQRNAVKELSNDIEESLTKMKGKTIEQEDIEGIKHSVNNSFSKVNDQIKTDYMIFLSHRRDDKYMSDFVYNYLVSICGFEKKYIFYSSQDGGIDQSVKTLEKQINETLTSNNTYVVFCIASNKYKKSEYCMFEGGAVWAVKQRDIIGLMYNNYDKNVPSYLKNMLNKCVNVSNSKLTPSTYTSVVNLLNSMIEYLNRNFTENENKKSLIVENEIPNAVELKKKNQNAEDYYNRDLVEYWNYYIINKGEK